MLVFNSLDQVLKVRGLPTCSTAGLRKHSFLATMFAAIRPGLNRILHNVAWISLFSVKDHVFLMNLTMPVMSFDHSRVYDDGVVCASCIGSDWRPPFFIPGFCSKRSITECHTGDYQCPLNLTTTAIVMHLTGILMALTCSTCEVYPATIHGTLTGAIVKAILDD